VPVRRRQQDEGRAYVYLGSASGLAASPAWTADEQQQDAFFGCSVAYGGGRERRRLLRRDRRRLRLRRRETDEGRAFVYCGSATGLDASPAWTADGGQEAAEFG
jgi:hypothetical protein